MRYLLVALGLIALIVYVGILSGAFVANEIVPVLLHSFRVRA